MSYSGWFTADKQPAQPGIYEVKVPNLVPRAWARWTGQFWTCWALSKDKAAHLQWQGVRPYPWRLPRIEDIQPKVNP
jgi:hypothetical protein